LYGNPDHTPNDSITGIVLRDGGVDGARNYVESLGQGTRFSGVTSMKRWFLDRSDVIEIHSGNWDTSNVTDCSDFAYGCNNLTKLDVSNWDTSNVTTFGSFAYECNNLTKLDVSNWDTSNVTKFYRFARGCNSLTELDVSNWDTSNVTDFRYFSRDCPSLENVIVTGGTGNPFADSPCTNYNLSFTNTNLNQQSIDDILVAIESAGTSDGTFDQSGGSAPSSTGEAAIDSLRSRGWTVTVTGGY
ncbi:MAG: BspA family leucine-rich repeat surface protein, partial [Phycisphaerae bacterium]